LAKAR